MQIEKWGMLELSFQGKKDGNPYVDYQIKAVISGEKEKVEVNGFYDGDGVYKVRFMPSYEGVYSYQVTGSFADAGESGEFTVTPNRAENHGPVRVQDGRWLAYADGTPYHSVGTTCYAWTHQSEKLQQQTLETLEKSCFNKLRFCVFPKYYAYNETEPQRYPYQRGGRGGQDSEKAGRKIILSIPMKKEPEDITDFDCYAFDPVYFRHLDQRVRQLMEMGIEADIILFHPYDKWGFSTMKRECNELYLGYMTARYGAYRNVWWSMANEYDLMPQITEEEWDAYGRLVRARDVYGHLCSIHNCIAFYDYTKDWITHCSMQRTDTYKHVELTDQFLQKYQKPVVWDEIVYEGNIDQSWGNISGQELVRRFWEATLRGGCAGHGETFVHPEDILWWAHGGVLHGESEPRIAFLKKIWDETPGGYLKAVGGALDEVAAIPAYAEKTVTWGYATWTDYELHYYGFNRPAFRRFEFPENEKFHMEVIDTWNMTIEDAGVHSGTTEVKLPAREWMAVRIRKV